VPSEENEIRKGLGLLRLYPVAAKPRAHPDSSIIELEVGEVIGLTRGDLALPKLSATKRVCFFHFSWLLAGLLPFRTETARHRSEDCEKPYEQGHAAQLVAVDYREDGQEDAVNPESQGDPSQ